MVEFKGQTKTLWRGFKVRVGPEKRVHLSPKKCSHIGLVPISCQDKTVKIAKLHKVLRTRAREHIVLNRTDETISPQTGGNKMLGAHLTSKKPSPNLGLWTSRQGSWFVSLKSEAPKVVAAEVRVQLTFI